MQYEAAVNQAYDDNFAGILDRALFNRIFAQIIKSLAEISGDFDWQSIRDKLQDPVWVNKITDYIVAALGMAGWQGFLVAQAVKVLLPIVIDLLGEIPFKADLSENTPVPSFSERVNEWLQAASEAV